MTDNAPTPDRFARRAAYRHDGARRTRHSIGFDTLADLLGIDRVDTARTDDDHRILYVHGVDLDRPRGVHTENDLDLANVALTTLDGCTCDAVDRNRCPIHGYAPRALWAIIDSTREECGTIRASRETLRARLYELEKDRRLECVCDTNPSTTDGPREDCPRHGRPYAEWVRLAEEAATARDVLAGALRTLTDAVESVITTPDTDTNSDEPADDPAGDSLPF